MAVWWMGQGEGARGVGEGWHLKADRWRQLYMQKGSARGCIIGGLVLRKPQPDKQNKGTMPEERCIAETLCHLH